MASAVRTAAACLDDALACAKHFASLPAQRRAQIAREWDEAAIDITREPVSPEIVARAEAEWRDA